MDLADLFRQRIKAFRPLVRAPTRWLLAWWERVLSIFSVRPVRRSRFCQRRRSTIWSLLVGVGVGMNRRMATIMVAAAVVVQAAIGRIQRLVIAKGIMR